MKPGLSTRFGMVYFGKEKSAHHHVWTGWNEELAVDVPRFQAGGAAVGAVVSSSVWSGGEMHFSLRQRTRYSALEVNLTM